MYIIHTIWGDVIDKIRRPIYTYRQSYRIAYNFSYSLNLGQTNHENMEHLFSYILHIEIWIFAWHCLAPTYICCTFCENVSCNYSCKQHIHADISLSDFTINKTHFKDWWKIRNEAKVCIYLSRGTTAEYTYFFNKYPQREHRNLAHIQTREFNCRHFLVHFRVLNHMVIQSTDT